MIGECFIATAHGPITVSDLQPGEFLFTWDQGYKLTQLRNITKYPDNDFYRTIFDNGILVPSTKDQKLLLRSGDVYKDVEDIEPMSSVMAFSRSIRGKEWSIAMFDKNFTRVPEHIFIANQMGIFGEHIHHINMDHMDNRPDNLIGLSEEEHRAIHDKHRAEQKKKKLGALQDDAVSVRAESWRQWFYQLPQEEKDNYWEKQRQGSMRSARQRISNGVHNFIADNPMKDPDKVILMKRSKVATTAYKLKDMGLSVEEDSWDDSVRHSGLYKSHCYRSEFIKVLFGSWEDFIKFLDSRNSKLVHMEFDYIGTGYELGIENFVVCNPDFTKGIVVKGN